jgi:PQQ-like domain
MVMRVRQSFWSSLLHSEIKKIIPSHLRLCAPAYILAALLLPFLLPAASTALAGSANTAVLTLSVSVGPPTTKTRVSGSGYTPGEIVCVGFDQTRVGSVRTDMTGSFSRTFRVPASALPGTHRIRGNGKTFGEHAEADFLVRTDWPQYHFDDVHTGFNGFENVLSPSNVSGLQVAWSFPGPCTSYSGPVAVDGTIYVGNYCNTLYPRMASLPLVPT